MSHSIFIKNFKAALLATAFWPHRMQVRTLLFPAPVLSTHSHRRMSSLISITMEPNRFWFKPAWWWAWWRKPGRVEASFYHYPPVSRIDPKKANPYVLPTQVYLYHRIVNRFSGSMSSRFRQNQKLRIKRILTSFSWHSERVLNSFTDQTG